MYRSHTLTNWNGSQDTPGKERDVAAKTLRTSDANAVVPGMTPTKENNRVSGEFSFGEGVLLTPQAQVVGSYVSAIESPLLKVSLQFTRRTLERSASGTTTKYLWTAYSMKRYPLYEPHRLTSI